MSLFHGAPNMDSLVALGAAASTGYRIYSLYRLGIAFGMGDWAMAEMASMDMYFESAGMILTLITLGKYFEAPCEGGHHRCGVEACRPGAKDGRAAA